MSADQSDDFTLLQPVVEQLCAASSGPDSLLQRNPRGQEHPSSAVISNIVEELRTVFFPGYFGPSVLTMESLRFHVGAVLDTALRGLRDQIRRALCFEADNHDPERCAICETQADEITGKFMQRLPEVRRMLSTDVQAAFDHDPAATSTHETVFCYPGVKGITNHRICHELYRLGVPLIPRMISEQAHATTGIDIHPGAQIGESFFIDHGTGVVIGETSKIGNHVCIYQGVTLGARSFPTDEDGNLVKGLDRHPIVEDNVVIYAGATILGRITVGCGAMIGGNVWVTRSVPPGSRVLQAQARYDIFESGGGI